jgi:hypothetical protein
LTIGPSENVVVNNNGISVGNSTSLTKSGLTLSSASFVSIGTTSVASNEITVGTTGGSTTTITNNEIHMSSSTAAVFFGPNDEWKLYYDTDTQNLRFGFYDSATSSYVTKMEVRNSS